MKNEFDNANYKRCQNLLEYFFVTGIKVDRRESCDQMFDVQEEVVSVI